MGNKIKNIKQVMSRNSRHLSAEKIHGTKSHLISEPTYRMGYNS